MSSSRERGLSLIEVVVFILVLGIGLSGMAVLYNQLTLASIDPLMRKQAVAIANSLLEEVLLRPFTYCDPDDPLVFTAGPLGCGIQEVIPPPNEQVESRYGATRFDNVNDYHGFSMLGSIQDISNSTIAELNGYTATIAVAEAGGHFPAAVPADAALLVTVTVTGPNNIVRVVLSGYRLRYAPNSP